MCTCYDLNLEFTFNFISFSRLGTTRLWSKMGVLEISLFPAIFCSISLRYNGCSFVFARCFLVLKFLVFDLERVFVLVYACMCLFRLFEQPTLR